MGRVEAEEEKIRQELNGHWEVISEGAQTILRAAGRGDAYETLKSQTQGRRLDESSYRLWVQALDVNAETRQKLVDLSPEKYVGLAMQITDKVLKSIGK